MYSYSSPSSRRAADGKTLLITVYNYRLGRVVFFLRMSCSDYCASRCTELWRQATPAPEHGLSPSGGQPQPILRTSFSLIIETVPFCYCNVDDTPSKHLLYRVVKPQSCRRFGAMPTFARLAHRVPESSSDPSAAFHCHRCRTNPRGLSMDGRTGGQASIESFTERMDFTRRRCI